MGLLYERTGRHTEALKKFQQNYNYVEHKYKNEAFSDEILNEFLNAHCLLGNSLRLNKKQDSAIFYNQQVIAYSSKFGSNEYSAMATINMAEVHFEKQQFETVIDSVSSVLPTLIKHKNIINISNGYYIRGMSRLKLNRKNRAIKDLKRIDSIFTIHKDIDPNNRSAYTELIRYYKKKNNTSKQLFFIQQLLKFDSIQYNYRKYIDDQSYLKIEKNELLEKQHFLTRKINKQNDKINYILIIGSFIICFLSIVLFLWKRKNNNLRKKYQHHFDTVLKSSDQTINPKITFNKNIENNNITDIKKSVYNKVIQQLKEFEKNKGFLKRDINAVQLSKKLDTNANYLGRIIKQEYNRSFTQYINNLRIDYVLNEMRNQQLIKYSIAAIAREAGYNNPEPFSKAFKIKTGLYPSEFIKKVKIQ